MKVLSLFDGISCGMVALERAGIPVERYVAYEIEQNAIKISRKNYPQIEHCGDVTKADFSQYEGIDLLIGGSPCQSLSIVQSKTRQHLDGKSKLFFEFARALNEAKPKWFLFENVASMNSESKEAISGVLGCEPIFIDSCDFSAQERPRLYWTNIPVSLKECCSLDVLKDVMIPADEVPEKYWYTFPVECVDMEKQVCGTLVHSNHEMHKRVFNPDFKCHTLTCVSGGNQQKKVMQNGTARKLMPIEYERLQTLPDNYTSGVSDGARYSAIGNGWTVDVIAHIFKFLKRRENEMELRIEKITFPEVIDFNFDELKQEITSRVAMYANMVYTEDQVKQAKADRANLNKFVKALSDERIKVKKQCLKPYEEFEAKVNELSKIVQEPIKMIDKQVKEYEQQKQNEKLDKIKEYWAELLQADKIPEALTFAQIFNEKWLNASVSMKSIQEEINSRIEQIEKDLETLSNLPEFGFEAKEVYKTTLDINKALNEGHRLSEIQKRKAEHEAEQARLKAEAELKKAEPQPQPAPEGFMNPPVEEKLDRMWISFKALLTTEDAMALRAFFESRNIEFKAV